MNSFQFRRLLFVLSLVSLVATSSIGASESAALDPSWLESARHPQTGLLSRGIRAEESAGYFAILNHARQLPLATLHSAATDFQRERSAIIRRDPHFRFYFQKSPAEFPTFADLFRNPEAYHGRPVTFRGHLRRLISFPAGENPQGLGQLHEAWLYTDGAQQNPVVVVCSELPPNLPVGDDLLVDFVTSTGYFFKRYGYEDRSGQTRFAPLILAQRLEWTPRPAAAPWLSPRMQFGLVVAAALVSAIVIGRMSRVRRPVRNDGPAQFPPAESS